MGQDFLNIQYSLYPLTPEGVGDEIDPPPPIIHLCFIDRVAYYSVVGCVYIIVQTIKPRKYICTYISNVLEIELPYVVGSFNRNR